MIDADSQQSTFPTTQSATNFWRAAAPVVALVFLSPVLTELLAGIVTHFTVMAAHPGDGRLWWRGAHDP